MNAEAIIALTVFVIGVVFYAGMMANRVSSLEAWRDEMKHELNAIHRGLRHIEQVVDPRAPDEER